MNSSLVLTCDGCGRPASPEHFARRLRRLEWSTRFRPVHIQTLFLGAVAPRSDDEFPYSPNGTFSGEAAHLLKALNIFAESKTVEAVQAEIQRAGAFLTHLFECPPESDGVSESGGQEKLMLERLSIVAVRIRRSLRPKRVVPISREFQSVLKEFVELDVGCPILLNGGKVLVLETMRPDEFVAGLQERLKSPPAT